MSISVQACGLYPEIEPYNTLRLKVDDLHELYLEEVGNPQGVPVVFLHGGPGGGFGPSHRRLFDPAHYRIILFDQRGAGQSTPHAELKNNTTWHLVADLETIRAHLGIEDWFVFGGSWGSTLALVYAQAYPSRVKGLILRGIFMCRPEEIRWFYQEGCHWLFPDEWARYIEPVAEADRHDMVTAYYKLLTHPDEATRLNAAKAWSRWEGSTCRLIPDTATIGTFEEAHHALAMARIECHYFTHNCWFSKPNQILADAHNIAHIPTVIVHGRYDVICPVRNAWELHQALPQSELHIIPDAGHAYNEPGILQALLQAVEGYKSPRN